MRRLVSNKFILIIVVLLTISCSKKADYDFIITNETDFIINSFIIGSGDHRLDVTVQSNAKSEKVTYEFDGTYFNFTEPLLTLAVEQYSDSVDTYNYGTGGVTSIPDLSDESVNMINIKIDEESSTSNVSFKIETN